VTSTPGAPPGNRAPVFGDGPIVTGGAYVALFLLGLIQGVIGTFQYSRGPGVFVAVCFDVAILATCLLGSWGMRSALGGVLPAAGWFIATLLLSSNSSGGSVLITDTTAGKWFLFGGAVCAAAGAVLAFVRWSKAGQARRSAQSLRRVDRQP
jgi:Family of unknown function (DUF6113)